MLASAALALSNAAGAAVIDGRISTIGGDDDHPELKVARIAFTVGAGTRLFFDSLVLELTIDLKAMVSLPVSTTKWRCTTAPLY